MAAERRPNPLRASLHRFQDAAAPDARQLAAAYAQRRQRDWEAFTNSGGDLVDYWAEWERRSHGWRVPVDFLQPVGHEAPDLFAPLEPLFDQLRQMPEVDLPPVPWLHLTWVRIGLLMSTDIMWSQVETFYVNASPRLHRVQPFSLRLGGISVADDERIYLGVEDGGGYREARRQAKLGVPKVAEVLRDDPDIGVEGDHFVPAIDIGFFTGRGSRQRVIGALEPYREIALGELPLTHLKMARLPIQPHDHYLDIDVIAKIQMYGDDYRKGYHN